MSVAQKIPAKRALIIDDNVDAAEMMRDIMEMLGHEAACDFDGLAGIERARAFQPDIVFLDIGMPRMSGFDVAVELRKIPGRPAMRIVALTGWKDENTKARAISSGCDGHIGKPATMQDIHGALGLAGAVALV